MLVQSRLWIQLLVKLYGAVSSITFTCYNWYTQDDLSTSIVIQIIADTNQSRHTNWLEIFHLLRFILKYYNFLVQSYFQAKILQLIRISKISFLNYQYKQRIQNMDCKQYCVVPEWSAMKFLSTCTRTASFLCDIPLPKIWVSAVNWRW